MKIKRYGNRYVVRIDKGEEIIESLKRVCEENSITAGSVMGIGATNKAMVGLFNTETKKYHSKEFEGDFEIAPLCGNVSTMDDKTYLHIHANLCDSNLNSCGGHLNSAIVSATFECVIDVIDGKLDRIFNEETGLNLLDI